MSGVAYMGTAITPSIKSNYISYRWRKWNPHDHHDSDGDWVGGWDYYTSHTDARITGTVNTSGSVYINGKAIAKAGDSIIEQWNNTGFNHSPLSVSPARSGSGTGKINSSANAKNVYVNEKLIAVKGSSTTTCLNTTTSLNTPVSSNVFVGEG